MSTGTPDLLQRDAGLLWHPYASLQEGARYAVTSAQGTKLLLKDSQGTTHEVIDGMASWWSAVHGYRHPQLDAAAHAQIENFSHVMFGGLTHRPRHRAGRKTGGHGSGRPEPCISCRLGIH
ncbi:aminotransferase class III-fold pyridoxal phosphate-dependent enzyme [Arthrobacter sp. MYb227]|uniref:aminotransferase class III-fold pyridoxal phosphate-dependent enzyme n=1 Tax=Arthrobacter sp. MYb227 TaxID=1848601 RepID=UPI0026B88A1F|nr:aminotransferase class III-fold pyridoxal phosphate-dependent enzyme [Arthrobacter sp. MYb227]